VCLLFVNYTLKVGWRGKIFQLIRISVSQNLSGSNKSSYWAGDVVKKQLKFHSVEIFPRDKLSQKTSHHSGTMLLHMRACTMGSQRPTCTTLSHFWLLGSKYEREMGPKTKINTYEVTEFSLVLTLVYLVIKVSDTVSVTDWIYSPLLKTIFQS